MTPETIITLGGEPYTLEDLVARASSDRLTHEEAGPVVLALADRITKLTRERDTAGTKLDESRRMRRLAEEAFGGRRRRGGTS